MKRSEMIRNMSETALKAGLLDINRINGPSLYEIMEKILSVMEEVGMQPPEFPSGRDVIMLPGRKIKRKFKSGWEPEDEAK